MEPIPLQDRLKHFQLNDKYRLIVETNPTYQPHLQADAYFAGIWPKEKGPAAKTWLRTDSPAQAFRIG